MPARRSCPGRESWKLEVKRLWRHEPGTEVLFTEDHKDETVGSQDGTAFWNSDAFTPTPRSRTPVPLFSLCEISVPGSITRDLRGKPGAEQRSCRFAVRGCGEKKADRPVLAADPDLGGPGLEVEALLLLEFRPGVGGRNHFDADFRGLDQEGAVPCGAEPLFGNPDDVHGFHAPGSGERTSGLRFALAGEEIAQQLHDGSLKMAVLESGRRHHGDLAKAVGFDAVVQGGKEAIGEQLVPTLPVEPVLVIDGRELGESMTHGF